MREQNRTLAKKKKMEAKKQMREWSTTQQLSRSEKTELQANNAGKQEAM